MSGVGFVEPAAEPHPAALAGGAALLRPLLEAALAALEDGVARRGGPVPSGEPGELAELVRATLGEALPATGTGAVAALEQLTRLLAYGSADPADPACAAHLHCPPLAVAVAAEMAAAALNPSLDSWDQAPAATALEDEVVRGLAGLVGFDPDRAAGVVTCGGTESNLMGLLLARDAAVRRETGLDPALEGLPVVACRLRVYASEAAHFSVQRNAALLGLGETAVVPVPVDARHRMDPAALERALDTGGGVSMAIVATAGTTDFGSVDPLPEIADLARRHGAWLHVDAAYGGGALFSSRLAGLLDGIAAADSVALDLHKLGWQPVAAGVFLAREAAAMAPLARRVAYLNPADDEAAGYVSLLGRSLRTTRRADVFKIAVTLRALGREGLGRLVDACHDLARHAADRIAAHPRLELAAEPVLTTVVFRYLPTTGDPDRVNAALRRRLLRAGRAVVGRTELGGAEPGGRVRLKLTLLNPHATRADVDALLAAVVAAGAEEDR
ncbi:pyridoxal phosphate-dependent decarboxylase family protein [Carbonactinospora thermoautotrophica]|uniref:pyridoxal phosphate-dependent decarboxylase family protein n=1 Tax=Carbonactinospora thermoautotrophica TaxID=1469144 RepID=UPI000A57EE32|nr:aminotransferase class I/II-fold pyridoxal phosphate-dependent enzyme [Carbonactinospora thermoautotrophica]